MELLILALPVVFLIAVWIFTIRPIRQRQREALAAQQAVHEGARIMTTAGIYGTVAWLDEENMGLEVSDGTLYAILLRLKNEGFVRHRWEHAETGPARKYYALTKTGQSALEGMRAVWADIARAVERAKHVKER